MRFRDRVDAGRRLADKLRTQSLNEPVVFGLARGGVPVAYEVAGGLDAPLDVFVARKVGAPHQPELGIGAIAEGGGRVANSRALRAVGVSPDQFESLVEREQVELDRRVQHYRGDRGLPDVHDREVVLVDDGLATGVTAEAALRSLRLQAPRRLVMAAPACAPDTAERLRTVADQVFCLISPADFYAVGVWYEDFGQTTDDEVLNLLSKATTPATTTATTTATTEG